MTARRIATTTRILKSAADLFAAHAYSEVSVDKIAEEAGITKMTLYQHFQSKNELALKCLATRLRRREEKLDKFLAELGPGKDPLLAIFDWLEQWLDPKHFRGCSFVKAVNELSGILPEVREIAFDAKQKVRQRFTALAHASRKQHPAQLGQELALLFEGAQSLALVEHSSRPAQVAKRIAALLVGAES
jgi:AcrR family transcriptional regulator